MGADIRVSTRRWGYRIAGSSRSWLGAPGTRRRFVWLSAGLFAVLTSLLFWRYVAGLTTTVSDPGDPLLLIWIMEWVQRALLHSPGALFDAPMFHPFRDVLAYSDPLLPQALLALPLRLLGAGPIAAYNAVFLGSIVLAGVLTTLLFLELTGGDRLAALLGALVATFPAIRLFHLAHLQMELTTFWPLVLLLVHRTLRHAQARWAAALALALSGAALASLYHGMFMALLLPAFGLAVWASEGARWKPLAALAGAGVAAALLLLPFARVYSRALSHIGQTRSERGWADIAHYFGTSPFADLARWLPSLAVRENSPQWIGGGAALLLLLLPLGVGVFAVARRTRRGSARAGTGFFVTCLPYCVLGILAIGLALGPELRFQGRSVLPNPFAAVASLPGVREIRDFQRTGFVVAIAAGAVLAVVLAELRRRYGRSLLIAAGSVIALTTFIPVFSSSLPAYKPPRPSELPAVYQWLARQPDDSVIFEVPLPDLGQSVEFLWAAVHHEKRLVHGYSGYLPLTDRVLRDETMGIHRTDFWTTLAALGTTHLIVHTQALSARSGGAAALASLHEMRAADRVASLSDAEVYRVPPATPTKIATPALTLQTPELVAGGSFLPGDQCLELVPGAAPLLYYVPRASAIAGLTFVPQTPIGVLDDALSIELSDDLRSWKAVPHAPLLSTSLSAYLERPTDEFVVDALIEPQAATFVRVSSARDRRLRTCDVGLLSTGERSAPFQAIAKDGLRLSAHTHPDGLASVTDHDLQTRWSSGAPQNGHEWLSLDLGSPRVIFGVLVGSGSTPHDHGRRLALDCAETPERWQLGSEVDGGAVLFERPHTAQMLVLTPARPCRLLRVRQTASWPQNHWSVAELAIYEQIEPR